MRRLNKMMQAAGIAVLLALPIQQADAVWWGGYPGQGSAWRHSYIYAPAHRWGSPIARGYIRDAYRYGPGYAKWRQQRALRYRYRPWYAYGW
jgi:hypothetical protein